MYYFCTYFDKNYLPRGLALYNSLRAHCGDFTLWVLCMDHASFEILENLDFSGIRPISLEDFEKNDFQLQGAKQNRSIIEYYFTCTPSLPLYVLNNWPEVDIITYLDADLFFFASPSPLFDEIGKKSIAIIGHRFSPHLRSNEKFGIYNVGWLSFRRDDNSFDCLKWWRQQCITWCYDREENGRFADQKYLDDWPKRFEEVVVLEHKGANLAPWNLCNYNLRSINCNTIIVDEQHLIFFHFHGLKKITAWLYNPSWGEYGINVSNVLRKAIYSPYLRSLYNADRQILAIHYTSLNYNVRSGMEGKRRNLPLLKRKALQILALSLLIRDLITRKLLFSIND